MNHSRRHVLTTMAAAGAATWLDPRSLLGRIAAQESCAAPAARGTLLDTLPLTRPEGVAQPFGVKLGGTGLDARLVTDLSTLQPDRLITPDALACIRTEAPAGLASFAALDHDRWVITISGHAGNSSVVPLPDLTQRARPMGAHLLECSGNNNPANFGLMSVSEYHGVSLADVVARLKPSRVAWGVLVGGMDPAPPAASSVPGASWVFPLASLPRLGAFLAVRMNGGPLPPDHGAPVRLVVPGWYACSWIKWVNEISLVPITAGATGQMQEFAARTHQARAHDLARDYTPADIQAAAMPVRVEKRRAGGRVEYRVVGIAWGGSQSVDRLAIRFGASDEWRTFNACPTPSPARIWSMWEYTWKPDAPGTYDIALKVPDPSVPQRRLESGHYIRQVRVDEV